MLRTIDLTDKEVFIIKVALSGRIAEEIDNFESVTNPFTKKFLQNEINELKSLRAKFVELL